MNEEHEAITTRVPRPMAIQSQRHAARKLSSFIEPRLRAVSDLEALEETRRDWRGWSRHD